MKTRNFILNPTRKQLILYSILGVVGISLLVISETDLFTDSMFQSKYFLLNGLILLNVIMLGRMHYNYWRKK